MSGCESELLDAAELGGGSECSEVGCFIRTVLVVAAYVFVFWQLR